ncbi:MAG TPA: hypothetical protein VFQ73_03730 [Flavisolibacter sp.]|nr:hypothetical protein [Flavisolibacter sp.]
MTYKRNVAVKCSLSILIFISVLLISCAEKKDPLAKVWLYNEDQTKEQVIENAQSYGATKDHNLTAANFIDLQEDGTFTSYLGTFEKGKWFFKNNNLILVNEQRERVEFLVNKITGKELVCSNKMKKTVYRFNGEPNTFSTPSQNPFSAQNNQWRIKPMHKESDAELRARMKNHFGFWEKYFAWGLSEKVDYLDVRSTATPLKIYGNGFELQYYEYLFPEWKNNFYDTADCRLAYENLYYKMYEKSIQWPDTKNRYERFVSAFNQLQGWMDEQTSPYVKHSNKSDPK